MRQVYYGFADCCSTHKPSMSSDSLQEVRKLSTITRLYAEELQEKCWRVLETMAILYSGCRPIRNPTLKHLVKNP